MTAVELDEATLVARARDRDAEAFAALLRRHQRPIFALCRRLLDGAGPGAEEVTAEVFLTAWRRLPELAPDVAFDGWLYRTATRRCLAALRTRPPGPAAPGDTATPVAALTAALGRLPPAERACWLLREVHGRSDEEIALAVEATPATVRARVAGVRADLAGALVPRG